MSKKTKSTVVEPKVDENVVVKVTAVHVQEARRENPGLHALYVRTAVQHILALNKAIDDLGRFSNTNLMDAQIALVKARDFLIDTDPAFVDANEILDGIQSSQKPN
jgi:hypothetical protein